MKFFVVIAVCFIITSLHLSQAQETEWETIIYVRGEKSIIILDQNGEVGRIPVPDELVNMFDARIELSTDKQWLAFQQTETYTTYLAHLPTESCCEVLDSKYVFSDGTSYNGFALVDFSPDSSELALSYTIGDPIIECLIGCMVTSQIALLDLTTMTITPQDMVFNSDMQPTDWNDRGMVFTHHRYCMEGDVCTDPLFMDYMEVRDTQTWGEISRSPIIVPLQGSNYGEHLPITGEYISRYFFNPPVAEYSGLYMPVVVYQASDFDVNSWREHPIFIHHSGAWLGFPPDTAYLQLARWVIDGQGVLIRYQENRTQTILLLRDGSQHMIDMPYNERFVTGTTNGWLTMDNESRVYAYSFEDNQAEIKEIAKLSYADASNTFKVLYTTPLGASVSTPFTTLPEPTNYPRG